MLVGYGGSRVGEDEEGENKGKCLGGLRPFMQSISKCLCLSGNNMFAFTSTHTQVY